MGTYYVIIMACIGIEIDSYFDSIVVTYYAVLKHFFMKCNVKSFIRHNVMKLSFILQHVIWSCLVYDNSSSLKLSYTYLGT